MLSGLTKQEGGTSVAGTDEMDVSGGMGATSLVLTVLAFAAPIMVVTSLIPLTLLYGGAGALEALLATTFLVLCFSAGFVSITRQVQKPGAFYSYVTAGLGRTIGLGGAFLTTTCYHLLLIGSYASFGVLAMHMLASFGHQSTNLVQTA